MNWLKPKKIEPEEPATMPDEDDPQTRRAKRSVGTSSSGRASTRLAAPSGAMGQEYSRGTLG